MPINPIFLEPDPPTGNPALAGTPLPASPGASGPVGFAKGLFWDTPVGVVKTLGEGVANALQSLNPTDYNIPFSTIPIPESTADRAYQLVNSLLLQMPDVWKKRYAKYIEESGGEPTTFEGKALAVADTSAKMLAMDILPGAEISTLASGTNAAGQDLSAQEYGQQIGMGLLKAIPAGKALSKLQTKVRGPLGAKTGFIDDLGKVDKQFLNDKLLMTEGEMRGLVEAASSSPEVAKSYIMKGKPKESMRTMLARELADTPDAVERMSQMSELGVMEPKLLPAIYQAALGDEVAGSVLAKIAESGDAVTKTQAVGMILKEAAKSGVDPKTNLGRLVMDFSNKFNLPVETIMEDTANTLMHSLSVSGQELNAASRAADAAIGTLMIDASKGGEVGMAAIKKLKSLESLGKHPPSAYSTATRFLNDKVEGFRRAMMVGQLTTAMRNLTAQSFTHVVQLAEDAVSGVAELIAGKASGQSKPIGQYFSDLGADINATVGLFNPANKEYAQLTKMLNSLPYVKEKLYSATSQDIGTTLLYDVIKNRGDLSISKALEKSGLRSDMAKHPVASVFDTARDFITAVNRLQEIHMRRIFFMGRLDANLRHRGIKSFTEVMDIIKSDPAGMGKELKVDIANALEHSLKQTFSYSPEAGIGKAILNAYKEIPFSTAIFPPFPRFLMNQYRWQLERSPGIFFNLFEPKFRAKLMNGLEDGFSSAETARSLGKAVTGMMLINGAWILANSDLQGPKYYQILHNPNVPNRYQDIRSYQPFASFAFIADQLKHAKNGTKSATSPNEYVDAMVGIRRLGEMPAFAALDIVRSARSDDPNAFKTALLTPTGQYFSSFFTPLHTLRELGVGISDQVGTSTPTTKAFSQAVEPFRAMRDVSGQELTGPTRQIIAPSSLPKRYDPFSGEPLQAEHPLRRQLLGQTMKDLSKFEKLVYQFPGISIPEIIGNQGHPVAENLVAEHIGKALQLETPQGKLGDLLADRVESLNLDYGTKKQLLEEIIRGLRDNALGIAQAQNPVAFLDKELNSLFTPEQAVQKHKVSRQLKSIFGEPRQ